MSLGIEVGVYLAYAFAVIMVYILGRFLLVPIRWTVICIISSLLGGIVIMLLNYFAGPWGVFVPLNMITAAAAGLLGIPGIVLLILLFI